MSKNIVQPDRPQVTLRRMHNVRRITKATNTCSENVTLIAFPLQEWLHERASMLPHAYFACIVNTGLKKMNKEITAQCSDTTEQVWIRFHCYWNTELTLDAYKCAGLQNFLRLRKHVEENRSHILVDVRYIRTQPWIGAHFKS